MLCRLAGGLANRERRIRGDSRVISVTRPPVEPVTRHCDEVPKILLGDGLAFSDRAQRPEPLVGIAPLGLESSQQERHSGWPHSDDALIGRTQHPYRDRRRHSSLDMPLLDQSLELVPQLCVWPRERVAGLRCRATDPGAAFRTVRCEIRQFRSLAIAPLHLFPCIGVKWLDRQGGFYVRNRQCRTGLQIGSLRRTANDREARGAGRQKHWSHAPARVPDSRCAAASGTRTGEVTDSHLNARTECVVPVWGWFGSVAKQVTPLPRSYLRCTAARRRPAGCMVAAQVLYLLCSDRWAKSRRQGVNLDLSATYSDDESNLKCRASHELVGLGTWARPVSSVSAEKRTRAM